MIQNTSNQYANRGLGALRQIVGALTLAAVFCASQRDVQAHVSYSGRDFGSYTGLTAGSKTIANQTVTGNYGWADAADGILGDSHRGRAFRFHLDNSALVTLTVSANATATATSLGGLNPAFSIYSGLAAVAPLPPSQTTNAPSADHDFGDASVAWRTWWVQQHLNPNATDPSPTDGSWNALGDWQIGGDGDLPGDFSQLSSLVYKVSASAAASANTVTGSAVLGAGDYTVFIGGNDIANKNSETALSPYGISATLSVTATPSLSISKKVFVAWPAGTGANWELESASTIDGGPWTKVTSTAVTVDGQTGVLLDAAGAQQYFRWRFVP